MSSWEGILSWCLFRVLEALNKNPADIETAKARALDAVKFLIEKITPPEYLK